MTTHLKQIFCMELPSVFKISTRKANQNLFSRKFFTVVMLLTAVLLFSVGCDKHANPAPEPKATIATVLTDETYGVVSQTTGRSGGEVLNDGGAPVTARGICWSSKINPTV